MPHPAGRRRLATARSPLALLALLLLSGCVNAVTVGSRVFVLNLPGGFHERERLELHEEIHRRQYAERGLAGFLAAYLMRPSERLAREAEAYAAELCYLERTGHAAAASREATVDALTSYGRGIGRERAARALEAARKGAGGCEELLRRGGKQWVLAAYPAHGGRDRPPHGSE